MNNIKIKKYLALIFLFIIVLSIFFIFLTLRKYNNNENVNVENDQIDNEKSLIENQRKEREDYLISTFITDSSESDSNIIKNYFADSITVDDFKSILLQEETLLKKNGNYEETNFNFESKLHYSDIEDIISNLNNSSIVNVDIIGESADDRKIYGVEIGKGDKVLFLDANIHSAEVANSYMLLKFAIDVVNSYENNEKEIVDKLNNVKLAIIFVDNPDGFEVFNFGVESLNNKELWMYKNKDSIDFVNIKFNANGVDLNRNFPSQNGGLYYSSYNLSSKVSKNITTNVRKYYPGVLGSESETKALMYFMLKHVSNIYAYIDLHSQGRVIYAGKPNLNSEFNDDTIKFAKYVASYTKYTVHGLSSEDVGYGNDGTLTDFISELANGFKFSSVTGRLSSDKYKNNNCEYDYKFPVITLETIDDYTDDVNVFKNEYYNKGIKNMLYSLLNYEN